MAAGDVLVQICNPDVNEISGVIAAMRVTANDKWLMTSLCNGLQVCIAHIEEA